MGTAPTTVLTVFQFLIIDNIQCVLYMIFACHREKDTQRSRERHVDFGDLIRLDSDKDSPEELLCKRRHAHTHLKHGGAD